MIEACRTATGGAGVRLMVAHITRFLPATVVAKRLVDDGEIGDLRMISVHRLLDGYPNSGWTLDRREGTAWLDWGSHGCDVVRWFAGRDPVLAFGQFTSYRRTPPERPQRHGPVRLPVRRHGTALAELRGPGRLLDPAGAVRVHRVAGLVDLNAYGRVESSSRAATVARCTSSRTWSCRHARAFGRTTTSAKGFVDQIGEFLAAMAEGREPSVSGSDARAAVDDGPGGGGVGRDGAVGRPAVEALRRPARRATRERRADRSVHWVPTDPGTRWVKDAGVVIEPPDASGEWKALTPNVVALPVSDGGGFRMYYTQSRAGPRLRADARPWC